MRSLKKFTPDNLSISTSVMPCPFIKWVTKDGLLRGFDKMELRVVLSWRQTSLFYISRSAKIARLHVRNLLFCLYTYCFFGIKNWTIWIKNTPTQTFKAYPKTRQWILGTPKWAVRVILNLPEKNVFQIVVANQRILVYEAYNFF